MGEVLASDIQGIRRKAQMIEIEFIQDYKNCYKKGDRKSAQPHFAAVLIDLGYAKAILKPPRHKMVTEAANK